MRFSTYINNQKCLEWELNANQGALFDLLNQASSWAKEVVIGDTVYYWVSRNVVIEELPLFYSKSDTVYRHFVELHKKELIEYRKIGEKDLIRLTEKGKSWNEFNQSEIRNSSDSNPTFGNKSESTRIEIRNSSDSNPTDHNTNYKNTNDHNNPLPPKSKKQKFVAENLDLPEWVHREDWIAFCEMRSNIKKPLTERACVIALAKLEKLKLQGEDISAVLEQSVFNNWQGLFAVHDDSDELAEDIDCQAVIDAFNAEFDGRYAKVDLNRTTQKIIKTLAPHLRNQTIGAFAGYFGAFNEQAGEYYDRFGFSFVMKPETLQKLREGAL